MTELACLYDFGVLSVLRRYFCRCALTLLCVVPSLATADAWDMFVARCLDPYEHLSLEIVGDLPRQPQDQMHEARQVFGPSDEGYLLVLDAAPTTGERLCAVEVPAREKSQSADDWFEVQLSGGRYVTGEDGWVMTHEWIEPRLMVRADVSDKRTFYAVVETDLES